MTASSGTGADLSSFLERVREDAGQESMTHAAGDCADWENSCSAHNAMRLAAMVRAALDLTEPSEPHYDLDGNPEGGIVRIVRAKALREAITAALTGKEADDDGA